MKDNGSDSSEHEKAVYENSKEWLEVRTGDMNSLIIYEEASSLAGREYVNFYIGRNAKDFREVIFHNAAHLNFTDLPLVSPILANMLGTGEADPLLCIEAVNEMVLHYFDYYLKDAATLDIQNEYHIPTK